MATCWFGNLIFGNTARQVSLLEQKYLQEASKNAALFWPLAFNFFQNIKSTNSSICPQGLDLSEKPPSSNHDEGRHFPCSSLGHLCLRGRVGSRAELDFPLRLPGQRHWPRSDAGQPMRRGLLEQPSVHPLHLDNHRRRHLHVQVRIRDPGRRSRR